MANKKYTKTLKQSKTWVDAKVLIRKCLKHTKENVDEEQYKIVASMVNNSIQTIDGILGCWIEESNM